MLSEEEIEEAKERLKIIDRNYTYNNYYSTTDLQAIETLLQYIDQLESDNYELNNRLNEYIEENNNQNKMIDVMIDIISN